MPDWDKDSPKLRANLARTLHEVVRAAVRRETPSVEAARKWQVLFMEGLDTADPRYVGAFRGEPGLENVQVRVGENYGTASNDVAEELKNFEATLQKVVAVLDSELPAGQPRDADQIGAVVDLCAWTHAEWIRIHPFANGNGRTARLWANSLAIRYGLPAFVRLRSRPEGGYGAAGAEAMRGNWKPTAAVFRRMLNDLLADFGD